MALVCGWERKVAEENNAWQIAGSAVMAGVAGFVGMLVGVKVQGSEIENIKERLDRMEAKLDRLIERRE